MLDPDHQQANNADVYSSVTLLQIALVATGAIVAYLLGSLVVFGQIGAWLNLDKFNYWYYNALTPFLLAWFVTAAGARIFKRQVGAWIAAVALVIVFGGMNVLFRNLDPTDKPLLTLLFTGFGLLMPRWIRSIKTGKHLRGWL